MADQATMSRGGGPNNVASPLTVVGNIADFGNDIASLAELQAKLTLLDAKDAVARATTPLIVLVAGGALALASLPVILMGVAGVVASASKLSNPVALLVVGLVALVIAVVVALIGLKGSASSLTSFRRSSEELTRNISWVRTVLVYSGRGPGKRQV